MKRYNIRKIIAEMPDSGSRGKDFVFNTGKLLGVMLSTIALTQVLFYLPIGYESLLMLYFLGVLVVSAITPRYGYGVAAALIASFAYDFFIKEPVNTFSFNVQFPITLMIMLAVTMLASTLTIMFKHQAYLAQRREWRSEVLFSLNQDLSESRDVASIAGITTDYLSRYLDCPAILFVSDPRHSPLDACLPIQPDTDDAGFFLRPEELARVHRIFISGDADALEEEEQAVFYQPVRRSDAVLAVAGLRRPEASVDPWNLDLIRLICRQAAHALELQYARDKQNELRIGAETEKTRGNLLRSISHDLRTPLTSILGASTAMLEEADMPQQTRDSLLRDTQENAKWLIRMVENILTVTRISQEAVQLHKTLEAAEEVIAQSVAIVRGRFPDAMIHVKIPDDLIMAPMDATLISQVIINLLENSVRNGDEGSLVLLTLRRREQFAQFEITDHGRGIPAHLLDNLFEIHTQSEMAADATRGIGIGLSICRTIIQAHGGTIEGHNRAEGGARFVFLLPLEEPSTELPSENDQ